MEKINPLWLVLLGIAVFCQGLWIFLDAGRHGLNRWLWGLLGLLNIPTSLIVYLLVRNWVTKNSPD
mgnify:CR=1 FL=1|jgi:hypothetical protein